MTPAMRVGDVVRDSGRRYLTDPGNSSPALLMFKVKSQYFFDFSHGSPPAFRFHPGSLKKYLGGRIAVERAEGKLALFSPKQFGHRIRKFCKSVQLKSNWVSNVDRIRCPVQIGFCTQVLAEAVEKLACSLDL